MRNLLIAIVLVLSGCAEKSLEPVSYVKWVENESNGLRVKRELGEIIYTVQYKPLEYIIALEQKEINIEKQALEKRREELKGMQYFTLNIGPKDRKTEVLSIGINSTEQYYERVDYASFDMQHDITLLDGSDTLHCSLFHFERNYGAAPAINVLLGFENNIRLEGKTLVFEDNILGAGIVKFTISKNDIESIPQLIMRIKS